MARTKRANHPHAAARDRAVARNGRDKAMPKGGAGAHNWGSVKDGNMTAEEEYLVEEGFDERDNQNDRDTTVMEREKKLYRGDNKNATLSDIAQTSSTAQVSKDQDRTLFSPPEPIDISSNDNSR